MKLPVVSAMVLSLIAAGGPAVAEARSKGAAPYGQVVAQGPKFVLEETRRTKSEAAHLISGTVVAHGANGLEIPVPGILVYAQDPGGKHIFGSARTDSLGWYHIVVPRPGGYLVVVDKGIARGAGWNDWSPRNSLVVVK